MLVAAGCEDERICIDTVGECAAGEMQVDSCDGQAPDCHAVELEAPCPTIHCVAEPACACDAGDAFATDGECAPDQDCYEVESSPCDRPSVCVDSGAPHVDS